MDIYYVLKLGLTALTSKALVEKGRNCVDMLTGNASFTLPVDFLVDLAKACDDLEQANEEVLFFGGKVNYQAKRVAEAAVKDMIRDLAGYIQAQSGGDKSKILSAGFDVRSKGSPVDQLGVPQNLRPILTNYAGVVQLRFDTLPNAVNYQIFANSVDPEQADKWELVGFTSKTAYTVEALESAKFYWFRVQAIGRKGLVSPMSQYIKALAA